MKRYFYHLLLMCSLPVGSIAQQKINPLLYEQTSEMGTTIVCYQQDLKAVRDFYSPYHNRGFYPEIRYVYHSPEQRSRLIELNTNCLKKMQQMDFNSFSVYGKVDYLLLSKEIQADLVRLEQEQKEDASIAIYLPFAADIYAMEKERRRGNTIDAPVMAARINVTLKKVRTTLATLKKNAKPTKEQTGVLLAAIEGLKSRLSGFFNFYQGYDPAFSWWIPKPYEALDKALDEFALSLSMKPENETVVKTDAAKDTDYGIKGTPIGQQALLAQLKAEFIPYAPEDLVKIAEKEFAFCDSELLKASSEMGFGNDWKKAQEKVKQSYVAPGKQPELIVRLQNDALDFIRKNDLIQIPALAEETWGMVMMSAERQLVNPFFTGGREISISYPTSTMKEEDKLMSMRGNNPYFSRGTVQHELLPGHHLQYYMNSRYKNYRELFTTPFGVEGWTLYWELLLYDKGFAKTPEERIGMLFWRMHRCARIIFSLNYHLGKWSPGQCVDFLVDRVGHEPANAEGEVRRSFEGGYSPLYQIAYMIGGLQLMAMKNELVDQGKMSYNEFHERVMKENLIPMELVRATLTEQQLPRDFKTQWKFYDFNKK
ncbi:DUF885 family protein [Pedobacter psychroterrae]|uniref:DUF885 family protein n=1 Tax=Pedobacter psychroterrae TaxID=2530453 RepID=A0A4R0NMV7_9SPHI|nr:DUF885 family protein [Pedobacter psychroterrae]TCD01569.1 DUF885 family protein [Pedobacter psychroterrae]